MKRNCNQCGRSYEAQRPTSKYCRASCRTQYSRNPATAWSNSMQIGKKKVAPAVKSSSSAADSIDPVVNSKPAGDSNSLVKATLSELEAAGAVDTMLGQQALRIATEMSGFGTAGGMAALSKELSRVMAEALRVAISAIADPVDELAARRDAKMAAG